MPLGNKNKTCDPAVCEIIVGFPDHTISDFAKVCVPPPCTPVSHRCALLWRDATRTKRA